MEYKVKPEEDGRKVRDILRGSMGVSYTALSGREGVGRGHGGDRVGGGRAGIYPQAL